MITIYKKENVNTNKNENEIEIRGLSTDEKITSIIVDGENKPISNGTMYICIDTGDIYMFDATNEQWNKIS